MSTTPQALSVTITDLDHAYGPATVLHNVDLDIAEGETLALLGPSGCGKTTLLRLIAGLDRPGSGSIAIGDRTVTSAGAWIPPERRQTGMVFQDWALFPHLSVSGNVGYGLPRSDRSGPRVQRALDLVGLSDLGDRMPATLSGGQQQRVAIARALAPEPAVLLLDEPFSNLDAALRLDVRSQVHRLLRELGITTIVVTHDQEEAFVLGDRVALMQEGAIVQVDTPQSLYTAPATRDVAEFIGAGTVLRAVAADGVANLPFGAVRTTVADGPVDVLVRPEQLALTEGDHATVEVVEYYGHDAMVFLHVDNTEIRLRCGPEATPRRGDRVGLRFNGELAVAFPARP